MENESQQLIEMFVVMIHFEKFFYKSLKFLTANLGVG